MNEQTAAVTIDKMTIPIKSSTNVKPLWSFIQFLSFPCLSIRIPCADESGNPVPDKLGNSRVYVSYTTGGTETELTSGSSLMIGYDI